MFAAEQLPYNQTHSFSNIVIDYLEGKETLQPFYSQPPTTEGIKQALGLKKNHPINRQVLVDVLTQQYSSVDNKEAVLRHIEALKDENTFTVCTAHQPNLFTGPLYFIYKILHAIRLSESLNKELPGHRFVPVFYMGCEDADLDELNHFTLRGKKYVWQTSQKGAVGRMQVDKELVSLIGELEKQLSVEPHGSEWVAMLRECFSKAKDIQTATFELVHRLFGAYGLIVLIPDHTLLKQQLIPVFEDDLVHHSGLDIVTSTSKQLSKHYAVQAHVRPVNLFYLKDDLRERIEFTHRHYHVVNTRLHFSEDEMKQELHQHPERFSPNVILRGLLQESILPNVAFIGGGGELAYWLQLKDLFQHYKIPSPVLVLRNSFLLIENHAQELIDKLQLSTVDIFKNSFEILNMIIEREGRKPQLNGELDDIRAKYEQIGQMALAYDPTLKEHVEALKTKTIDRLVALEKKMLRAERKRHEARQRQIEKLKKMLFPGGLQERTENIGGYYARWGSGIVDEIYRFSLSLEQEFTVLRQTGSSSSL